MTAQANVKTETLLELAQRCEAALGPDCDLNEQIAIAAMGWTRSDYRRGGKTIRAWHNGEYRSERSPEFYTASIDAAITLVPSGWWAVVDTHCRASLFTIVGHRQEMARAATPALALCAAALRARAA